MKVTEEEYRNYYRPWWQQKKKQPLFFLITTAGTDRHSVCFEQHQKAEDILQGRKIDPTFYPVIYGASDDADWSSEEVWRMANPSLGHTIDLEKVRNAYLSAKDNPASICIHLVDCFTHWFSLSCRKIFSSFIGTAAYLLIFLIPVCNLIHDAIHPYVH